MMMERSFLPKGHHQLSEAEAAVGNFGCAKALRFSEEHVEGKIGWMEAVDRARDFMRSPKKKQHRSLNYHPVPILDYSFFDMQAI